MWLHYNLFDPFSCWWTIISSFLFFWLKLLWTCLYASPGAHTDVFLLLTYLGVELLACKVGMCPALADGAKPFSKRLEAVSYCCYNQLPQLAWLIATWIHLLILEVRSPKIRVLAEPFWRLWGGWVSLPSPASRGGLCSLAHGLILRLQGQQRSILQSLSPAAASIVTSPLSRSLLPPLWLHWAHLEDPGSSPHLKSLNLVTSAKTLFPNKIFTGSRG